jgi:predicted ATPase
VEPIVKSLTLKRFKSFVSEHVEFDNPTFLVGENGSGKSNLVDAIAFMADAMAWPLASLMNRQGGVGLVMHKQSGGANPRQLGLGISLGAMNEKVVGARMD